MQKLVGQLASAFVHSLCCGNVAMNAIDSEHYEQLMVDAAGNDLWRH